MELRDWKEFKIEWRVRKGARSLSLSLRPLRPIRVLTPKSVSWFVIENFLQEREAWIRKHLQKFQELEAQHPRRQLKADEKYFYLGEELNLKYLPTPLGSAFFSQASGELRLHLPEDRYRKISEESLIQYLPLLKKFYRREAEKFLTERIRLWSHEMDLAFGRLSFRNQKTRWGSCNSRGDISLNWKLISAPLSVIDSVLIHELAHRRHMNHSPAFWSLVERYCPDHEIADQWLRKNFGALEWLSADL
jgi:predicted metal-dependent hydrolase